MKRTLWAAGWRLRRDNRIGDVIRAFPAVFVLAGDDKDLLPGPGFAKTGDVGSGDVALAAGCRSQQAQVTDPAVLHSSRTARGLAIEHDVLHCRAHRQPQPHRAVLVIVNG